MSKRRVLYYLALALLVTSQLLILSNNVPILASFRWVWAPTFLLITILYYNKVFHRKEVIAASIYGLFYSGILPNSIWIHTNDWYKEYIFEDFYAMIVFVLLFALLSSHSYWKIWAKLAKIGFVFFIITGIMTIIATEINPIVIRASYSSFHQRIENYDFLYRLGFGSYGYMTAAVALIPILVYLYKTKNKVLFPKTIILLSIFFTLFVLFRAQIFANILVAFLVLIISFAGGRRIKKSIFFSLTIALVFFLIPQGFYIESFKSLSKLFDTDSLFYDKFNDFALFIDSPEINPNSAQTGAGSRASRYPALFEAFMNSPFFGDASYDSDFDYDMDTGAHLYFMSRLALWGIFGFAGYLLIIRNVFKPVIKLFDQEFKFYYYLSLFSVFALGLLKNLTGREPYIMLLIIIPGLYLIKKEKELSG